ncbi:hypothetical protein MNBD_GAMMA26-1722 [hydrothermal vent metagenome]|uniref:PEGA domain-containing protein n=1 Tax=hydrothermal vent metagenome TaxID=652676 RepID=A0A3B1B9J4_9ZZZZ
MEDSSGSVQQAHMNTTDTIIQAAKLKQEKSLKGGAIIAVAALLIAVAVYGFYQYAGKSPSESVSSAATAHQTSNPNPAANKASVVDTAEQREAFKNALGKFEQDIQPILDAPGLINWSRKRVAAINLLKEQAVIEFAKGLYLSATATLEEVEADTLALKVQWNAEFQKNYVKAQQAFESDDDSRATLSLNKALNLKPDNREALALQARLEVLPEVIRLQQQHKIAVIENNPEKQLAILRDIVALDPQRPVASASIQRLEKQLAEGAYSRLVNKALEGIEYSDPSSAAAAIAKASKIKPNSPELAMLNQQLNALQSEHALARSHVQAKKLKAQDDWQGVRTSMQRADAQPDSNKTTQQYLDAADKITALQKRADAYLTNHERLKDANIRHGAKSLVRESVPHLAESDSLSKKVFQLSKLLDRAATLITVRVISDGKTDIAVLGEGIVGEVFQKDIKLSPGRYILEGKRRGYRNKQIILNVDSEQPLMEATLVCDERIR